MILDLELQKTSMNKATTDNSVLAKNGVNTVFENSVSNIRKKFFLLLFLVY